MFESSVDPGLCLLRYAAPPFRAVLLLNAHARMLTLESSANRAPPSSEFLALLNITLKNYREESNPATIVNPRKLVTLLSTTDIALSYPTIA